MQKEIKYISVFSLWVAILILFSHAAIPHQQHLSSGIYRGFESGTMDTGNGKVPMNCQFFRDISFEKTENNSVHDSDKDCFSIILAMARPNIELPDSTNKAGVFFRAFLRLTDAFFQENISVRGSPRTV